MFNEYRILVREVERVLEVDGGAGCTEREYT